MGGKENKSYKTFHVIIITGKRVLIFSSILIRFLGRFYQTFVSFRGSAPNSKSPNSSFRQIWIYQNLVILPFLDYAGNIHILVNFWLDDFQALLLFKTIRYFAYDRDQVISSEWSYYASNKRKTLFEIFPKHPYSNYEGFSVNWSTESLGSNFHGSGQNFTIR